MKKLKWVMFYIVFIMSVCIFKSENVYADGDGQKAKNLTEFRQIVYKDMLERKEKIVIDYSGKDYKSIFQSFKNEEFLNYMKKCFDYGTAKERDEAVNKIEKLVERLQVNLVDEQTNEERNEKDTELELQIG